MQPALSLKHGDGNTAVFSLCGTYRYQLSRLAFEHLGPDKPRMALFVLLNPSTADAEHDDPTVRRCIAFAHREGCERLLICNLFGYRSTEPWQLARVADPVGPNNDHWIRQSALEADLIVAGWGAHPEVHGSASLRGRADKVLTMLSFRGPRPVDWLPGTCYSERPAVYCLGTTKDGHPRHPLYLAKTAALTRLA